MFPQRDWQRTYETGQDDLFEEFYRPFLDDATRYDRVAGYLSLRGLASALEGVDSMLETDGQVRVIAGADLRERERGVLFPDRDEVFPDWVESQLAIIAELLDRGNLTIKVADIEQTTGVFHSKLGIGEDDDENVLSFEGSVNEIAITDGWVDEVRPDGTGKLIADISAAVAEEERRRLIKRVEAGVKRARTEGKWLGEVPTGFTRNDDGFLKPVLTPESDEDGYLEVRAALEDIENGESYRQAARSLETTRQTLSRIHQNENRRQWYLNADAEDPRVVEALENVQY